MTREKDQAPNPVAPPFWQSSLTMIVSTLGCFCRLQCFHWFIINLNNSAVMNYEKTINQSIKIKIKHVKLRIYHRSRFPRLAILVKPRPRLPRAHPYLQRTELPYQCRLFKRWYITGAAKKESGLQAPSVDSSQPKSLWCIQEAACHNGSEPGC